RLNINQVVVVYPFPESVINGAFLRVHVPPVFLILERTRENLGALHHSWHKKNREALPASRMFISVT
ncbi:hypothetical protein, partial [Escherichia coli]|uniref:hypothetical protein n=1 Tax=Escherichia coli TaxID=562 RepID=UPI00196B7C74